MTAVVRCLAGDDDLMRVAFLYAGIGDSDELRLVESLDVPERTAAARQLTLRDCGRAGDDRCSNNGNQVDSGDNDTIHISVFSVATVGNVMLIKTFPYAE